MVCIFFYLVINLEHFVDSFLIQPQQYFDHINAVWSGALQRIFTPNDNANMLTIQQRKWFKDILNAFGWNYGWKSKFINALFIFI